jgi:putative DNA primase/helicase
VWRFGERWRLTYPEVRPLYALDRLATAPEVRVFVVEGEKCAEVLSTLGLPATTSPAGAEAGGKADWSPLAGREAVVLPDAGDPGRKYAEAVRERLAALDPPARVAVVNLPGLEAGEDVEQFVGRVHGGDLEAARRAIEKLADGALAGAPPAGKPGEDADRTGYSEAYAAALKWCAEAERQGMRFDAEAGSWYCLDSGSGLWRPDRVNAVPSEMLRAAAAARPTEAGAWARYFREVATAHRPIVTTSDAWDSDPGTIGTPKGVFLLGAGAYATEPARFMVTRSTAAAPGGRSEAWDRFLSDAMGGDEEMIAYLRRWAGYALSGSTREHAILFIHGPGGNGKSVFIDTLRHAFGDYARTLPINALLESRTDRHPAELAMLRGARLAVAHETPEGRRWNEAVLKQLSGGDAIPARFMGRDWFEFEPTHKLAIVGNHAPSIGTVDDALRRRLHVVPFTNRPAVPDSSLGERLRGECEGVLAWAVEGHADWAEHGLAPPPRVLQATSDYLAEQDSLGAWIEECCTRGEGWEASSSLYASWKQWCDGNGVPPGSGKSFATALKARGLEQCRKAKSRGFAGITVTDRDASMTVRPSGRYAIPN